MKTDCPHCQARYAIPDDQVVGKVLRVRCQRCRGVMKVVGPTAACDGEAPRPPTMTGADVYRPAATQTRLSPGAGPVWWAGIAGAPHGPYSAEQLWELVRRGDVHDRTYLWTRGMPHWERIASSPRLGFAQAWVLAAPHYRSPVASTDDVVHALDDRPYRPEPTQTSGYTILDERAQAELETAARRGAAEELGLQAALGLGMAGLSLALGGAMWLVGVGLA